MKTFFILLAFALLVSCKKNAVTQTPPLQFTIAGTTYQFYENITAKQVLQNGSEHISIEVQKDPSTYRINIFGNTQIGPGTYLYSKAIFTQFQYDYGILERDFSLQVLSYQNGYLNATFNSSRGSNGIISHLKIN